MNCKDAAKLNTSTLAYLGDAVYSLAIREMLVERNPANVKSINRKSVGYVSASGQARAARDMLANGFLTEDEEALLKRARNHRTTSMPKNADAREYKLATGFEALLGYLHLSEMQDRCNEVIEEAIRIIDRG